LKIAGGESISKLDRTGAQHKPSKKIATFTKPEFKIGTGHIICIPDDDVIPLVVEQNLASFAFRHKQNLHNEAPDTNQLEDDPLMVTNAAPLPRTLVGSMLSGMKGAGNCKEPEKIGYDNPSTEMLKEQNPDAETTGMDSIVDETRRTRLLVLSHMKQVIKKSGKSKPFNCKLVPKLE
jgi:hypothetical protein